MKKPDGESSHSNKSLYPISQVNSDGFVISEMVKVADVSIILPLFLPLLSPK